MTTKFADETRFLRKRRIANTRQYLSIPAATSECGLRARRNVPLFRVCAPLDGPILIHSQRPMCSRCRKAE